MVSQNNMCVLMPLFQVGLLGPVLSSSVHRGLSDVMLPHSQRRAERSQCLEVELANAPDFLDLHQGVKMFEDLLVFLDGGIAQLPGPAHRAGTVLSLFLASQCPDRGPFARLPISGLWTARPPSRESPSTSAQSRLLGNLRPRSGTGTFASAAPYESTLDRAFCKSLALVSLRWTRSNTDSGMRRVTYLSPMTRTPGSRLEPTTTA